MDISTPADVAIGGDKIQLKGAPITVEDAKAWFEQSYGKVLEIPPHTSTAGSFGQIFDANSASDTVDANFISQAISVAPEWTHSKVSTYLASYPILYVPVNPIPFFDQLGFKYKLVFYRENGNQINSVLQLYQGEEAYAAQNTQYQVSNFTGLFAQIRLDGCIQRIFSIENGLYKNRFYSGHPIGSSGVGLMSGPGGCYDFGTSFGQRLLAALQSLFSGECGGGNGDVTVVIIPRPSGSVPSSGVSNVGTFGQSYGNTDGGGGGGGDYLCTYPGACLPAELTNDIFNGDGLNSVLLPLQPTPEMTDFLTNWDAYDPKLTQALYNGLHQTSIASTEIERINIVRQYVELLMSDQTFRNNESHNFNVSTIWYLGKYLQNGFTGQEFVDLYTNPDLFRKTDPYLNENNFDADSKEYVRLLVRLQSESKDFQNSTSGFLRKEDLYDYVKNSSTLCPNCNEGQLHNMAGDLFEKAYNAWQASFMLSVGDYEPNPDNTPTTFKHFSPSRNADVVPDGFMKSLKTTLGGVVTQVGVDQKAHWVECKASNKNVINLSDYDGQIKGEIEALSLYQPWACQHKIAAVTYVTTFDMTPSPKLVRYANARGIWILNSYPYFQIVNGKMMITFTPTYPFG